MAEKKMSFFDRYLTIWVGLCMVVGVFLGRIAPEFIKTLRDIEFAKGSQINLPIAILIWLMIYPMMLKVDFSSVLNVGKNPKGLLITAFVNWFVKPFSMAIIAFFFFKVIFSKIIPIDMADQYIAGTIILAAAPCTAMVFVWSYLVDGDPAYTLVQVALNDLIMLVAFAPIVGLLVSGASNLTVPMSVLFYSVIVFIVIPLSFGVLTRYTLLKIKSREWFDSFIKRLHPVAVSALLLTLVLIFAFQSDNITNKWFHVILIAVPILVQVYFNSSVVYLLMKKFRVNFEIAAPGALIGASNFFELAVATAITLFGPESGAALATVVGVLVEVPVMLSVVKICKVTKGWYCKV